MKIRKLIERVLVFKSKTPKSFMESIIKKVWKKGLMDCDLCIAKDLNEVLILRSNKFSKYAPEKTQKARRVCWVCAKMLFKRKLYNFGHNWRMVFLDNTTIMEKNKAKYMVIHA